MRHARHFSLLLRESARDPDLSQVEAYLLAVAKPDGDFSADMVPGQNYNSLNTKTAIGLIASGIYAVAYATNSDAETVLHWLKRYLETVEVKGVRGS